MLKLGIRDLPFIQFKNGVVMSAVPQTQKYQAFALRNINQGLADRTM